MKFILFALALIVSSPALADQWYVVNTVFSDAPACTLMKRSLPDLLSDLRNRFGQNSVTTYPETYEDGSKFLGVVVDRPDEGPIQIPLASTAETCRKSMNNVAKVEAVLEEQRRNVGEPWYFMSTAAHECVKASRVSKDAYTPELYAKTIDSPNRHVTITYNKDKSVAILTDGEGTIIPMLRGEVLCRMGLAKTSAAR